MKKPILLLLLGLLIACTSDPMKNNPLLQEYDTPFGTPPFDKIKTEHFMPAIREAMAQHKIEIDAIVNNQEEPTFENTVAAYDRAGELLSRVNAAFFTLNGSDTNEELQALAREITPELTKHRNEIQLNPVLFERISRLYEKRDELDLDSQQRRTLEKYYDDFVRGGAALSDEDKETLKDINTQLSNLSLQFGQNLLAETNAFKMIVDNVEDLAGLPESNIRAAASLATSLGMEGKYVFTPNKPSWIPFLQYVHNRELREKLYRGYFMRGDNNNENDNKEIIGKIVNLKVRRAKLLGFDTYADFVLVNNMAKTPEAVFSFLQRVWDPALKVAKEELAAMQKIADSEGAGFKLESWDWWYYAEKLRKEKYDLDEQEIKPYLKLENVRDGMFYVASKLYGLSFEKRTDIPVYNPAVETYEVKDQEGSHLAILYLDYPTREGKNAGAWCSGLRGYKKLPDGSEQFPLVTVTTNFPAPVDDQPVLLSWDEAETLFHEFGHALDGFFGRGNYDRICGALPRDMVELPSQINEHWAIEPEVLQVYALHYQTNEPMPRELMQKLVNSSHFNQGFITVEFIAAALLDMEWHASSQEQEYDVNEFEKNAMKKYGLIDEIIPRYRSTYFSHIFNGGYAVGYYVYLWAEILDADAFDAFKETGDIFNQEIAGKFRKYILTEGGWDEPMNQYLRFRGKEPTEIPLLRNRGLLK
ncbi:MAG: M3 family metallopeptidase [Bacteroidales bacterium]|jgi:peptidyl-dipeptidase Dcp|nr:M3 family metallopeptidase [Bacteroidales bacterium]MDD2265102.1 M3 family metallopeptidase [Bacteroidales bacterium]MDD2832268.1 M3 family metallopeptidase [Bacteroidales bacterium]MDD3209513.1 M3 family metallopeptidase [Bacteroidales bacterium]MDD3698061.1 M3 family metallopeptidase [Bacteroidales bacterium]